MTSLIKFFFRELPDSLLTFALYPAFIKAVKLDTSKAKLESILHLCLQLPDAHLSVLIYLMDFLHRISVKEALNKMNSFNLAVCFAPNIIYTKMSQVSDAYINEERVVVQLLIENSGLIGKVSEAVYERSLLLNSLCCDCLSSDRLNATNHNDLLFMYENDQENSSFAHHAQSAGSTSLSSYCGSSSISSSKKEKKKRRSSSLKELMNTIQNSISKFRRRSASEKNDKTTCSIITCNSLNGLGPDLSCSSRAFDDKAAHTPFAASNAKQLMATPICASLYATPRINKRNAEESLQSTTKKYVHL